MTNEIKKDIQSLTPSAIIELFEIDLTKFGDIVYRFHFGTNEVQENIIWDGQEYTAWAGQALGFDMTTSGTTPRPKLALGNAIGTISALMIAYNDCVGAKVTRKRTLKKYLDAVNFTGGVNPTADPDAGLPDDVFYINRKSAETNTAVELELSASYDLTNKMIPARQIIQNLCTWRYRGSECGYTGSPVSNNKDTELGLGDCGTPTEVAFINAREALKAAITGVATALSTYKNAQAYYESVNGIAYWVRTGEHYNIGAGPKYYVRKQIRNQTETLIGAVFAGANVTLGDIYRTGVYVPADSTNQGGVYYNYYKIEIWGPNTAITTPALASLTAAQTAYNTAVSTRATAQATYDAALLALQALPNYTETKLYKSDVCGKRLASCKSRFCQFGQSNEIPFGGFPGAGLIG